VVETRAASPACLNQKERGFRSQGHASSNERNLTTNFFIKRVVHHESGSRRRQGFARKASTWWIGAGEPDFPHTRSHQTRRLPRHRAEFHQVHSGGRTNRAEAGRLRPPQCGLRTTTSQRMHRHSGRKALVFNLTQALVDPGDEVVIPVPYWVTYQDVVHYAGGKCVFRRDRTRRRVSRSRLDD